MPGSTSHYSKDSSSATVIRVDPNPCRESPPVGGYGRSRDFINRDEKFLHVVPLPWVVRKMSLGSQDMYREVAMLLPLKKGPSPRGLLHPPHIFPETPLSP